MLTPEGERLERMLARCQRMCKEEKVDHEIHNLISEYSRLNEILASHTDHHHDIDNTVMEKLTKSIDALQEHFTKLCQLLGH
jgi:ATP-dependent Zn protease